MTEPVQFNVVSVPQSDPPGSAPTPGLPEKNASVIIVARDDVGTATWPYATLPITHEHADNGFYKAASGKPEDEPGAGEWLLVVLKAGTSPVAQKLTLEVKGGVLVVTAGWGVPQGKQLENTALTVSIVNHEEKQGAAGAGPPKQSQVFVRLFRRLEVVSLACLDKTGTTVRGTRFDLFAKSRAHRLFSENKLNDGAIFTLLTVTTRMTQTWVKSRSPKRDAWILLDEKQKSPPPLSPSIPVVGKDLGILDFYQHLDKLGRIAPGSVIEAGIFGHAYVFGPIVWNTDDYEPSFTKRDPDDFDGRSKDWVPGGAVATSYPVLNVAIHPTRGALHAWGCNHMTNVLAELNAAWNQIRKKTPRDQFFLAQLPSGRENLTLDHLKRNVAQYVVSSKIGHSIEEGDASTLAAYCGTAAQWLNKLQVWGAPPGMGSNFGGSDKQDTLIMHIIDDPNTENSLAMKYYVSEFGSAFVRDDLNYMSYMAMLDAPLPDPGWATERFIVYLDGEIRPQQQILRLPSGLAIYREPHGKYVDPVKDTLNGVAGHRYVASGAKVDHVEDRGPNRVLFLTAETSEDTGVFVDEKGKSTLLRSAAGKGTFSTNTDAVQVITMDFAGGTRWKASTKVAATTLQNGVLETVLTQWYW